MKVAVKAEYLVVGRVANLVGYLVDGLAVQMDASSVDQMVDRLVVSWVVWSAAMLA